MPSSSPLITVPTARRERASASDAANGTSNCVEQVTKPTATFATTNIVKFVLNVTATSATTLSISSRTISV